MNHPIVNQSHPRQDIYRERVRDTARPRYRFASMLLPVPGAQAFLCDIGGGAGEFCEIARSAGYATVLVDGNVASVAAEEKRGYAAQKADLTAGLQEIADQSFDVVVCLEVIEHIVTAWRHQLLAASSIAW